MTFTTETAPQKQKTFNEKTIRKQDHGDAAMERALEERRAKREEDDVTRRDKKIGEQLLREALADVDEFSTMTHEELEAAATALLHTSDAELGFEAEPEEIDPYEMMDDDVAAQPDAFRTEAELGLKSKHEIRKEQARRGVEIDVVYGENDNGDNDFHVPVFIRRAPVTKQ